MNWVETGCSDRFYQCASFRASMPVILGKGINVVSGSMGLSDEELNSFGAMAKENRCTLFLAPNFAIGAVLMMKFAKEAAEYIKDIEVIEYHHDQKLDAPSGTAKKLLMIWLKSEAEKFKVIRRNLKLFCQGSML